MTQLRVHKLRAEAFYAMLRQRSPECYTIAYDLQQVQSLPKLPVQETYYSRQLGLYNFGLCDLTSNKNYCYTWLESEAGRGSVEIGSTVYSHLTEELSTQAAFQQAEKLRLFSDGCGGQNKNNFIVAMVYYYLQSHAPENIKEVELVFPVRGHSFLPCDRLFGRIEKNLRTVNTITQPAKFHHVFSQHANHVKVLGKDWRMLDWRTASKPLKKVNKIQDAKRIFLTKEADGQVKVRAEPFFRVDTGKPVPLQKQPVPVSMPPAVPLGRCLSEQKVADIHKLLGVTYGEQWWEKPELKLHKDL